MRFKPLLRAFAAAFLLAASAVIASAQVTQINGKVTLKQADGTAAPVAGAQIDIYRTDIKWEDHIKTNKKGEFQHAGIPFIGVYTIAVSAPGAQPTYRSGLRLSQQPEQNFELSPGDGSRLTLDQIKTLGAAAPNSAAPAAAESKEAKAAREEMDRKNAEITKKNTEITKGNETVARTFNVGNEALKAKNYDAAIAAYDEGLAAREEPALLTNKAAALRMRGADRFNSVINSSDQSAKTAGLEAANKDWLAAADAGKKAVDLLNAQPAPTDSAEKAKFDQNKYAAMAAYAEAMRLVGTKVDKSRAEEAFKVYSEFAAIEPDPAKKSQRTADAAKILFDANAFDRAIEEYRKVLAADPENADANLYLGLALFNTGDKTKFQEAANYLGKFSEKAPDTNPLKADAKSIIDFLRTQENIKPEKVQTTRPASGRRRP